ncbi:YtxH domain-containing protein, partial [Planococcus sp. SIMBA_143]
MAEKNNTQTTVENQGQEKNATNENKTRRSGPIKRTVAGSLLGATVGYLATPENGKKLLDRIDQEKIKSKSLDFGKAAKEKSRKAAV